MNVIISPNINKVSERLDKNGNVIDPRTKQVIAPKEQVVYSAPAQSISQNVPQSPTAPSVFFIPPTLSLKEIKQALKTLEEMKEKKVAELKAELEDL